MHASPPARGAGPRSALEPEGERSAVLCHVSHPYRDGASLSFTYETIFMVMRNFPWCTQTGEIAGNAAAIAARQGISPKTVAWQAPYFR